MHVLKAAIIDDEELARERIKELLQSEPGIEVIAECSDGETAVRRLIQQSPDLLFLDVQMPGLSGFEVLDAIRPAKIPAIIFVTAYDRYAIRAFDHHALDYLLKPFDRERFFAAVGRARLQIERERRDSVDARLAALLSEVHSKPKYLERLVIKSGGRVFFRDVDEVEIFEGCANYVKLCMGKESHLIRGTLDDLEKQLDPAKFVRIHRSVIVRLDAVKEIRSNSSGDQHVIMHDGARLKISRTYRNSLKNVIGPAR